MATHCPPATIPQHEHFPLQFSLPIRGSWLHSYGSKRSEIVVPGKAVFIPSGETHGTQGFGKGELITINAELDWCAENCDLPLSGLRRVKLESAGAAPLQEILREASALLRMTNCDEIYIESIGLTAMLATFHALGLRPQQGAPVRNPGPVRRVTRWIDEHLDHRITLAAMASVARCSTWHLVRLFNTSLGTSPGRYVAVRRLERSRDLLSAPGSEIADVALRCGFSSQSHFTRAFVREYGQPPGVYRSKRRNAGRTLPS